MLLAYFVLFFAVVKLFTSIICQKKIFFFKSDFLFCYFKVITFLCFQSFIHYFIFIFISLLFNFIDLKKFILNGAKIIRNDL